jgi:hypothetical protein
MMKPTIHLNGTSQRELELEAREAYDAVDKAIEAMCRMTVHGRDYYPQGNEATHEAIREHRARIAKLQSVKDDLEELVLAVMKF